MTRWMIAISLVLALTGIQAQGDIIRIFHPDATGGTWLPSENYTEGFSSDPSGVTINVDQGNAALVWHMYELGASLPGTAGIIYEPSQDTLGGTWNASEINYITFRMVPFGCPSTPWNMTIQIDCPNDRHLSATFEIPADDTAYVVKLPITADAFTPDGAYTFEEAYAGEISQVRMYFLSGVSDTTPFYDGTTAYFRLSWLGLTASAYDGPDGFPKDGTVLPEEPATAGEIIYLFQSSAEVQGFSSVNDESTMLVAHSDPDSGDYQMALSWFAPTGGYVAGEVDYEPSKMNRIWDVNDISYLAMRITMKDPAPSFPWTLRVLTRQSGTDSWAYKDVEIPADAVGPYIIRLAFAGFTDAENYQNTIDLMRFELPVPMTADATTVNGFRDSRFEVQWLALTNNASYLPDDGVNQTDGVPLGDTDLVPDISGMSQSEATAALEAAGYVVNVVNEPSDTVATGEIIRTEPAAGSPLAPGSTVTLVISSGAPVLPATGLLGLALMCAGCIACAAAALRKRLV